LPIRHQKSAISNWIEVPMSFQSGRATFCRFAVMGDAPAAVEAPLLSILQEHAFKESDIGAPEEVESGWTTGVHLFDTQFTYEKNGYGPVLMWSMRLDTHKIPGEVRAAYRKMNEQAAAEGNPSGFASKRQKKDATDLAGRQLHEDLAAGKFRRSKTIPLMWDLSTQTLYCGAVGNVVIEQLSRLMRDSFAVDIEELSAGVLAGRVLRGSGRGRDYEDVKPSPFTPPPAAAHDDHDDADGPRDLETPVVPWTSQSTDLKDFLGNELAIWLWWLSETAEGTIATTSPTGGTRDVFITIDKALDMDCAWGVLGKQTLRSDGPTRLREAAEALAGGKWPRKLGLLLSDGEHQWEFTFAADRFAVSSAALPQIAEAQSPREVMDARVKLITDLSVTLDAVYQAFLAKRTASGWPATRGKIREWIAARRKK
jgi:hypothetical protein